MRDRRYGEVKLEKRPDLDGNDEPCLVLRARDANALSVLEYYAQLVAKVRFGETFADARARELAVDETIAVFKAWPGERKEPTLT